jgi:hypothetical protein
MNFTILQESEGSSSYRVDAYEPGAYYIGPVFPDTASARAFRDWCQLVVEVERQRFERPVPDPLDAVVDFAALVRSSWL